MPTIFELSAPKLTWSTCFINSTTEKARAASNSDFPPKRDFKRQNETQGPAHTLYTNDFRNQRPKIDQVHLVSSISPLGDHPPFLRLVLDHAEFLLKSRDCFACTMIDFSSSVIASYKEANSRASLSKSSEIDG